MVAFYNYSTGSYNQCSSKDLDKCEIAFFMKSYPIFFIQIFFYFHLPLFCNRS